MSGDRIELGYQHPMPRLVVLRVEAHRHHRHRVTGRNACFVLAAFIALAGCFPAPRAYRIFLPPAAAKRSIEERLTELQQRCERGDLTAEECTRRRKEILGEVYLYK